MNLKIRRKVWIRKPISMFYGLITTWLLPNKSFLCNYYLRRVGGSSALLRVLLGRRF